MNNLNTADCQTVRQKYPSLIEKLVDIQRTEYREAIAFLYKDGSTSDIYKGEETSISLTKQEQESVISGGDLVSSIHTHPEGFDLSTIDIMTGVMTEQEYMCVAVPVQTDGKGSDYVMSCLDLSSLSQIQRGKLFRRMRRSSVGVSNLGRLIRKEFNLNRFDLDGCRIVKVD